MKKRFSVEGLIVEIFCAFLWLGVLGSLALFLLFKATCSNCS